MSNAPSAPSVTIVLKSGGAVALGNPFIFGNGIAGDTAASGVRWFADDTIAAVQR